MDNSKEYSELIKKVACAMLDIKNIKIEEKFPVGLIDINLWEWPQGVGLYGLYKFYNHNNDKEILGFLHQWYSEHFAQLPPERNVNTTSPMLTLAFLAEETKDKYYLQKCEDWAMWLMTSLKRTNDNAFQHTITGDENDGQILIDTVFMAVLFLAKCGVLFKNNDMLEEAKHQCLIHIKYLYDTSCGLYFHGFDFNNMNNYGKIHWARGNSWYTCGLVELLEIMPVENGIKNYFLNTYVAQVNALAKLQNENGMWHTVLDDASSYTESSATAAFAYGILKGVRLGYLDKKYEKIGLKAVKAVVSQIDQNGIVQNVSYGTPVGNSAQFYKDIPVCPITYGQALTIMMLTEALLH